MHIHNFFLTLIIYTLTFSLRMKHSNVNSVQIVSEFVSDEENSFYNLAVDDNGGWVYVGSHNHLYQLSADLKLQINYTSMEFNSSIYCESILLELDYHNQQLIACHKCYPNDGVQMVCRAHNIRDISEILANATEYESLPSRSVFFISPRLIQNSSALYFGLNFGSKMDPKIAIRHLDRERFLSYDKQIILNYDPGYNKIIYGFNSGDFSYFLTGGISVSQQAINSEVSIGVNLIEIRHEGQNYQFDDIPLTCCTHEQKLINETLAGAIWLDYAYFYEHKSDSEFKTDSHEIDDKMLFTLASRSVGFQVCAYNMNNIHSKIQKRRGLNGEIIYEQVGNIGVRAMTVTSINNHIVLFIGTDNGHLQKISIKLDSFRAYTAKIVADITIDEGYPIESNMLFDSKKNFLYVMAQMKLTKVKIQKCDEYNTSYTCLSEKDPYCGWCVHSNKCCLKPQCNYEQNSVNWISHEIDKYVSKYPSPRNKFSRKAEWNVTFNLLNSHPFKFNDHKIICSFRFNNSIINTTTSVRNENQINCVIPSYEDLPPTPINEHSIKAQLSIQTNLFPVFQKIEVEFFDCSTYKLCTQCVSSTPCNWHINEQKCSDEAIQSYDDTIPGDNFNVSDFLKSTAKYNCPRFGLQNTDVYEYYIHANAEKKERFAAWIIIPKILINESFTCRFDTEENKIIASASLQNIQQFGSITRRAKFECDGTIFTYTTPKSSITVKWSILWNGSKHLENFYNDSIVLYKCANMGNQCANCLNKNYKCLWNSKTGECKYNDSSLESSDINNHWLNDIEKCSNEPFVIENIKNQTNWLTDNIYWIIIIIMTVILTTVAAFFIYCRNSAEKSRKMQQQLNKMGMEMISMSQWVKRVVIENEINLDENESNMLRLPNVTIQYTSIPRFAENEIVPKDEYELPSDDKWEIPRAKIVLGNCLGEGQFGKVVEAKVFGLLEQDSVETVAVKMLKNGHTDADMVNLVTEMELMKLIGEHENVLRLLGCCTINGPLFLITEYSPHGNLLDFLRKNHDPTVAQKVPLHDLSEKVLITFALQIAKGMEYLVSIKCVHRDLAARNILVFDNYVMKIADFGLARDIRQINYYRLKTGGHLPVKWMAPEALKDRRHTSKSDVWSFGVLIWEIMTLGGDPYPLYNDAEKLMEDIESGHRLKKPANCSINTYSLMCKCWNYLPDDRPEFTNIIKELDVILISYDETTEHLDPHDSNLTTESESDDTEDETNDLLVKCIV